MTRIRTESKRASCGLVAGYLALALTLVVTISTRDARSEQSEERVLARGHFNRGVELAKAGSYEAALAEFQQAYRISPHFSVLYNVGQAELALGRPVAAVGTLRRYLAEGGEQLEPARRAEVESTIAIELERLGPLDMTTDAPPTARAVDAPTEQAPLADLPPLRQVPVAPTPTASRRPAPSAPTKPTDQKPSDAKRVLAYTLGGAGILLASASLVHYAWNRGRYEDWQDAYAAYHEDPRPPRRSTANQLAESVDRASRVSVALAIGGGVMLGTGTVLFFSSGSTSSSMRANGNESWLGVRGTF